jgi:NADH-quinone oxidoreductase subunit N
MMTGADLLALLPIIVLGTASVVVMLTAAFRRGHALCAVLSLVGLSAAIAVLPVAAWVEPRQVTALLTIDHYALFYTALILVTSLAVTVLSFVYLQPRQGRHEEFYILLLLAALGSVVLVSSSHFASFFIGLELLSVSLYALIAYPVGAPFPCPPFPLEAGVKYLILAGVSSAFLLFGMALIYAESGTLDFSRIGAVLAAGGPAVSPYSLFGLALILTGVGFKLALVPFHMWTPDVYEGAPAPVAAFVATVSKGAMLALLLRYFAEAGGYRYGSILLALSVIAVASMLIGNLLALLQNNVKRILAYSSIAHLGYLLVAFLASGRLAVEAVSFYLVYYFITMVGAFAIVTLISSSDPAREADDLEHYRGLFWRRPWLAGAFTAMLLSLAGIPLTIGFVGKFYVVAAGVDASLWILVSALVVGSAIGLFYYLRILVTLYLPTPAKGEGGEGLLLASTTLPGHFVLAILTLMLVWLGVFPSALMSTVHALAGGFA